jgi:hypothetical protein
MYEIDITPPLGSTMPGYFDDRKATGIKDRLYAKSCVIESEGNCLALLVLDTLFVHPYVTDEVRRRVQESVGIAGAAIMIAATHTHTGGPVFTTTFLSADQGYLELLAERATEAIITAYHARKEARIGYGMGQEGDIAFNRRFWMKDGSLRTNPGVGNPDIHKVEGPIDRDVLVVRIDDANGNPIGIISNYTCHTDTVGGTEFCADFPGQLSAVLKKTYGESMVSLFFMGASGNINHVDVTGRWPRSSDTYKIMGRILAGEVIRVREKIRTETDLQIEVDQQMFMMDYRLPLAEDIAAARLCLENPSATQNDLAFAAELLNSLHCEPQAHVEVQAFKLGQMAFVGVPAELFVEFGLQIKEQSSSPFTMINELCSGHVVGYICPQEAIDHGGYEPRITSNSRIPGDMGNRIVESALSMVNK